MANRTLAWACAAGILGLAVVGSVLVLRHALPSVSAQLALGQRLFFDPSLSADGKTSCSSCHQPEHAYSDGRPVSKGAFGLTGTRNTPSLLALSDGEPLFWDGRRERLEDAVLDPFLHPVELALPNDHALTERLETPTYRKAFAVAFGTSDSDSPTRQQLGAVLAAYVRSLPKPQTPFDRYQVTHDTHLLSQDALQGMDLFSGKAGCAQCHKVEGAPARFSDDNFHSTGTGLQNVAAQLPVLSQHVATENIDVTEMGREIGTHADVASLGRFVVTHQPADIGLFRTPSLRYVANTGPYMHDGSVPTLEDAVDQEIYWRGLSSGQQLSLTVRERLQIIAFLRAASLSEPSASSNAASTH
jgi:cytochrome c peroxidase